MRSRPVSRRAVLACGLAPVVASPPLAWAASGGPEEGVWPVRFGLTSVVVRENLDFFRRWAGYLEARLDRPVEFVQRRSYREVMQLLEGGEIDFSWICGYPYVMAREAGYLDLLAVPEYQGAPYYRSYIIVHRDSPFSGLRDLRGRVFAYSDPDSNSGYLVPREMLARQTGLPEAYFRQTFFTFDHGETIEAVAERVADGGAVDSYVWEYLKHVTPTLVERTRVVDSSRLFGFPPLVAQRNTAAPLVGRMKLALLGMDKDEDGKALLAALALDRFADHPDSLFDGIAETAQRLSGPVFRGALP